MNITMTALPIFDLPVLAAGLEAEAGLETGAIDAASTVALEEARVAGEVDASAAGDCYSLVQDPAHFRPSKPTPVPMFRSRGSVYALSLSSRRLKTARNYFSQPVIRALPNDLPDIDGTDWEKGPVSLNRLKEFEQARVPYRNSMSQLGAFLNRALFQDGRVLQIGSGLGMQRYLGRSFRGSWIVLDYDSLIAREARTRNPNSRPAVGSAYRLPFANNAFDVVYSHAFLDVLTDLPNALAEIARVLKPGGRLLHLMDCVPNTNVLGGALEQRGFGLRVEGGSFVNFFDLDRGLERVRVFKNPSPRIDSDPRPPEFERALAFNTGQIVREADKAPVVSYSLLSIAHLLGLLEAEPGFSHLETGVLVSTVPTERQWPPMVIISNPTRWQRMIMEDAPSWSLPLVLFGWKIGLGMLFMDLMRRLRRPARGMEIYLADYVLAEKKKVNRS